MHFSQVMFCYLPLGSKNSTFHSVFKHPHTLFMHLTVRFPIPHSQKTVGKYNHIISVHSVKTSVNFLQMQLHTKNSIVKQNYKFKVCDFSIQNPCATEKKSLLTYHTIRVFNPFWALSCSINLIHSKLATFTP